jgi:hypothetical protein
MGGAEGEWGALTFRASSWLLYGLPREFCRIDLYTKKKSSRQDTKAATQETQKKTHSTFACASCRRTCEFSSKEKKTLRTCQDFFAHCAQNP